MNNAVKQNAIPSIYNDSKVCHTPSALSPFHENADKLALTVSELPSNWNENNGRIAASPIKQLAINIYNDCILCIIVTFYKTIAKLHSLS